MSTYSYNAAQSQAYRLITEAHASLFITGKAGTGKTTFLRHVQQNSDKRFVVLAPTGIAAILAGGETIHSFFGFPLEVMTENTEGKINQEKRALIRDVDAFIIDEVSMVRCDIIDAIDRTLREVLKRSLPFGGKQMIFVGDLFQLEPVVTNQDREIIEDLYGQGSPYFFKANVFKSMDLPCVSFEQVYRQNDDTFVTLLNHIRDGRATNQDLSLLNRRLDVPIPDETEVITLCSRRDHAERINQNRLDAIPAEAQTFEAALSGEIKSESQFPAPNQLTLKVGCQVMFLRNDPAKRWMNGTIGTVTRLENDEVVVTTSTGSYTVPLVQWEANKYSYNRQSRKVEKKQIGTFTQYPLRLAWAITIHKSQGMTFDRMILDLGRGLFSKGQLYVALSRVRSLDGLYLTQSIQPRHLSVSEEVIQFARRFNDETQISTLIEQGPRLHEALQTHDYDRACQYLLQLALQDCQREDYRHAALHCAQCFAIMVQDEFLFGTITRLPLITGQKQSLSLDFVMATFSLYGRQYHEAIRYAEKILTYRSCPDALYIKARALAQLGQYCEADQVNVQLAETLDGTFDAKTYYEVARLNVEHMGDPGAGVISRVVRYRPGYLPAIKSARELMRRQGHALTLDANHSNPLVDAFNSEMDADAFMAKLDTYKCKEPDTHKEFIHLLSHQTDESCSVN